MTNPRALTDAQLAAGRFTPQQLVGLGAQHREAVVADHPANLFRGTGGQIEVPILPIPGGPTIGVPVPDVPNVAGDVASAVSSSVADAIKGAVAVVLGPVAEIGLTLVVAAAGLALVVWAVVSLAKNSKTAQNVASVAAVAAI